MNEVNLIELEATGVRFFSEYDESAFFDWLNKLACVQKYEGHGRTLYITVNSEAVDEDALREFLALFRRYGVAMRQLIAFDRDEFAEWFREECAYWYSEVFGRPAGLQ
jgi:hypothetical protein